MKPQDYRESCMVMRDIHYEVSEASLKGTHSGSGMLHTGRVVWVQKPLSENAHESSVSVYAEGGRHCLARSRVFEADD
jgi:hypothetical protein